MDDLRDAVNRLGDRIGWLEERVADLEALLPAAASHPPLAAEVEPTAREFAFPQTTGIFPVIGRAMLGIAGAYVLRALAESGAAPPLAIVVIALAYAATWLLWATRAEVPTRFVSLTYAITAALILGPMLAELTLRFHILSSSATAALLIGFALGSAALAWKRNLLAVTWVGITTAICTSIALMVLSRDMVPYVSVLLAAVLVSEGAAARKRWISLRALVAPGANLVVWTFIYIFSLPESARVDYVPVARTLLLIIPSMLFLIYGASVAFRSLWSREPISIIEIFQTTLSFVLAGLAWFWFAQTSGETVLGLASCLLAFACYGAALSSLKCAATRNYHVYAAWGAAFVLTGAFLALPARSASLVLSGLAVAMTVVAVRAQRLMPGCQAFVYLVAAAFASGLLPFMGLSMTGTLSSWPAATVWGTAACVVICFAVAQGLRGELRSDRLLRTVLAVFAASVVAAFCVSLLKFAATVMLPSVSSIAAVRTLIVSGFAVGLAFAAGRWHRVELLWSAYCGLVFLTIKLVLEDFRIASSGSLAVSVFLYAVALMLVPRFGRAARQHTGNYSPGSRPCSLAPMATLDTLRKTKAPAQSSPHGALQQTPTD